MLNCKTLRRWRCNEWSDRPLIVSPSVFMVQVLIADDTRLVPLRLPRVDSERQQPCPSWVLQFYSNFFSLFNTKFNKKLFKILKVPLQCLSSYTMRSSGSRDAGPLLLLVQFAHRERNTQIFRFWTTTSPSLCIISLGSTKHPFPSEERKSGCGRVGSLKNGYNSTLGNSWWQTENLF